MSKSLFLLKTREDYSADPSYSEPSYSSSTGTYIPSYHIATGMWNSASFVVDALNNAGLQAGIGMIPDANSIDAAVMAFNPTHVFIEGLWVTPAKMLELKSLFRHRDRIWIVRIHSEIPFLASEGIAMDWIAKFLEMGVIVAPNAPRATKQITWEGANLEVNASANVKYLPNIFPTDDFLPVQDYIDRPVVDIGCFGAFRPLKNQLQQAFAAVQFGQAIGKTVRFHVNGRADAGGTGPANNIAGLFQNLDPTQFELVVHGWESREQFLESLREIDILMQVSISETFNIVAADAVLVGKPVIATDEIPWMYQLNVDDQNVDDIVAKMLAVWQNRSFFITKNRIGLQRYNIVAVQKWTDYLS
jgi:hypothetical protein